MWIGYMQSLYHFNIRNLCLVDSVVWRCWCLEISPLWLLRD